MASKQNRRRWRVLVGMDYPPDRRAEPGDIVDNLPEQSVPWLVAQGYVEPVEEGGDG